MKLRQIPCYVTRTLSWSECAWALRRCLAAHGCLSRSNLLQLAATALDTDDLGRLDSTLTHLIRTTDIAGNPLSVRCASAPPRSVRLESNLPVIKLGEFSGCGDRSLNRVGSDECIDGSSLLPLEQWEGPREALNAAYLQGWLAQLRSSPLQEQSSPGRESYHVARSSWSRSSTELEGWALQRSSLGRRWRFYLASPQRWLEIDQDTATRLRFCLHLQAGSPIPAYYASSLGGLKINVPFLPGQEFRTLSLMALEPIAFGTPFEVHPEFSQFALNYLNERLGLAFQEAKL